jgi:hypothetical protein
VKLATRLLLLWRLRVRCVSVPACKSVWLDDMPSFVIKGRVVAQAVSHLSFIAESLFHALLSSCGIYGGRNGTGTGFSENSLSIPSSITVDLHYHLLSKVK